MLLLCEGFESQQSTTDYYQYGPFPCDRTTNVAALGAGPDGGTCRQLVNNATGPYYLRYFLTKQTQLVVGFALYFTGTLYAAREICGFRAYDNGIDYLLGGVILDSGRIKIFYNNSTSSVVATGSLLTVGNWYYLEVKFMLGSGDGSIEVRLDGVSDCSVTGIATNYNSIGFTNSVYFATAASYYYIDDIYICNLLGTAPFNDWLGPIYIKKSLPVSVGGYDDFPVFGVLAKNDVAAQSLRPTDLTNYLLVDDQANSPLDVKQGFYYNPLTPDYTILGVVQQLFGNLMISPTLALQSFAILDNSSSTKQIIPSVYNSPWWSSIVYDYAPDGNSWTLTKLQNTQFGLRLYQT